MSKTIQTNEELIDEVKTDNAIKKYLTSEVKYIIGIIVFLAGVVAPYYQIKQDIALIQQNHFAHMEILTAQMEQNVEEIKDLRKTQVELMQTIAENSTRIKILEK